MRYAIEELVEEVGEIATSEFPDLSFLDPDGVLQLRERLTSVVCLRLELPGNECLHLGQVLIDIDGAEGALEQAKLVVSSTWRGYGRHLAAGHLFDPKFRGTAFHTGKEPRPWLEVRFKDPVAIERITLRNRDNSTALRARGIRALVRRANGRWRTVHDAGGRAREFTDATERIFGSVESVAVQSGSHLRDQDVAAELVRILSKLQLREYDVSLVRALARLPIAPEDKHRFREIVNARILRERELEWTSHGVRRSFRFWSQQEKEQYVAYAMALIDDLRELSENVCLGFGSVLAIIRDHDLIPHDDDLDIILGFEPTTAATIAAGLKLIEKSLRDKGYVVAGENPAHRLVSRRGVKKVDVFVGVFEGDQIAWFPGHRGALQRDTVFPSSSVEFLGSECEIPAFPERYLENVYGPQWAVPDPHFKHSGSRGEYSDILR